MKKLKKLLILLVMISMTVGCVKYNANMTINSDKSMDFEIIYAFDKELMKDETPLKDEDIQKLEKEGYKVSEYTDDKMKGFKMSKHFKNIDELSSDEEVIFDLSGMLENNNENIKVFKVVKGTDKNTYYGKFKFEMNSSELEEDNENLPDINDEALTGENSLDDMDFSSMMSNMELKFNVTLPSTIVSNNATSANGKTLTWDLTKINDGYVEFVFEIPNGSGLNLLYIGIGVGVILLACLGYVLLKKNKNNVNNNAVNESLTNNN